MARLIVLEGGSRIELADGWQLATTATEAFCSPDELPEHLDWMNASVPGTVAAALSAHKRWSVERPAPLHDKDFWYRIRFEGRGLETLRFDGLATIADVWLNGVHILHSESMFLSHDVDVTLAGNNCLHICFRALGPRLRARHPGEPARWRPRMTSSPNLRHIRATLMGHMPGWWPAIDVIGPWRPVWRLRHSPLGSFSWDVRSRLAGSDGAVEARLTLGKDLRRSPAPDVEIEVDHQRARLERTGTRTWEGALTVPGIKAWWPHTHGDPVLYPIRARVGGNWLDLGRTGFRHIEIDRGTDGNEFTLRVNGVPVFCRGAVWTSGDPVGLAGTDAGCRPWLELMRAANLNMVRLSGTLIYESTQFHRLCDELGILVWQDFMFANFDYPTSAKFQQLVAAEARQLLTRLHLSPSLAVLCGGSEVYQQAAMVGVPAGAWQHPIFEDVLPSLATELRPDVPYVCNSPSGGVLPFSVSAGTAHYFGVGAYARPLDDARRAGVRFASECLAFANIPHETTLEQSLPVPAFHHPLWKEGTPRDQGASWDFEDVRDGYLETIYGFDARALRRSDPERYAYASRAVVAEIFERTLVEWRRCGSATFGALVWLLQDLRPGAGWGIVDSLGEPKSPWFALKRASRSLLIALTDEGLDGLAVHIVNETAADRTLLITLTCLREGWVPVLDAQVTIEIAGRSAKKVSAAALLGRFFDFNYAYQFGPPAHDITFATMHDAARGEQLGEAWHAPCGRRPIYRELGLRATPRHTDDDGWVLEVSTQRHAQSVHIIDRHFRPDDDFFDLNPMAPRRIRLVRRNPSAIDVSPHGEILALNSSSVVRFGPLS
jgi:beta-mannosidase